jgi:ficolin
VALLSLLALSAVFASATEEAAVTDANTAAVAASGAAADVDTDTEADTEVEVDVAADAEVDAEAKRVRPINCMDAKVRGAMNRAGTTGSGVYRIKPLDGGKGFDIFCDMKTAGGGWNVFSRRFDGSVDFYRPWVDYKKGFGSVDGEHWLGLDKINRLSRTMPHRLRIDLKAFDGSKKFGTWKTFMVDDEEHKYTLTARGFRDGGIGNSLRYHSGRPFSTYDRDNDAWANNCASYFHGAWWYGACHHSNLNGRYYPYPGSHPNNYADGADWLTFKGHFQSAKKVSMKFK